MNASALPRILVVAGPTASGKTALAVELAKIFGGEIISADSMQVYRGMDIGSAKPTVDEREGIPHHMLDAADPREDYSVSRYEREASACVDVVLRRGALPIVAGGSGLYINALVSGISSAPAKDPELRSGYEALARERGPETLWRLLLEKDPESASRLHPNDLKRVIRALEVFDISGVALSEYNLASRGVPPRYDAVFIGLKFGNRRELYDRIDRRVDGMISAGLFREVGELMAGGLSPGHTAMQAIGYKEAAEAISGKISREEAIETIKRESRRYAKRQMTWFGRDGRIEWIDRSETPDSGAAALASLIAKRRLGLQLPHGDL